MLHASKARMSGRRKELTIENVLRVAQVVHKDLCHLPVMHGDHEGQVGELTRLSPGDKGGENVLKGDWVLGLKGTLVDLSKEIEKLQLM
jgi:hypothetical protein